MIVQFDGLPEMQCRDIDPPIEGCYIAEWDDGNVEPAWYVKYPHAGVFQRKCGTEEGCVGWGGNVGRVVRWCPIYMPSSATK